MNAIIYILFGIVIILIFLQLTKKSNGSKTKKNNVDENNLNDYYQGKTDSFKAAQKAGLVSKEIRIKSNNSDLKVPNIGPYDGLIGWAAYIIATGEDSSTSHVQRMMSVNADRAYSCTQALISIGMLKENGTKQHTVLIRDLNKIKEILNQF
jgi:hypothetical protein